jgi:hypothetical protein
MSMIRRTCENTQITQFIIQQLLTLHSTLLKSFWRKNQSTKFSLFSFFGLNLEHLTSFEARTKKPKRKRKKSVDWLLLNNSEDFLWCFTLKVGGAMRDRTADLLRARQALSQLSYNPVDQANFFETSNVIPLCVIARNLFPSRQSHA